MTPEAEAYLRQQIANWFNQYAVQPVSCPVCQTTEWEPIGFAAVPMIVTRKQMANPPALPMAFLSCAHCGYLFSVHASKINLSETPTVVPDIPNDDNPY